MVIIQPYRMENVTGLSNRDTKLFFYEVKK